MSAVYTRSAAGTNKQLICSPVVAPLQRQQGRGGTAQEHVLKTPGIVEWQQLLPPVGVQPASLRLQSRALSTCQGLALLSDGPGCTLCWCPASMVKRRTPIKGPEPAFRHALEASLFMCRGTPVWVAVGLAVSELFRVMICVCDCLTAMALGLQQLAQAAGVRMVGSSVLLVLSVGCPAQQHRGRSGCLCPIPP